MADKAFDIPFNKPFIVGKELDYIKDAVDRKKISGNGHYSKLCHRFFEERYGYKKCLMTTSCTDALEMSAILADIKEGDEVILPSYTFVSTANAFVLRNAKLVFVDSEPDHPNMDASKIEESITPNTKAIVVVHYAGKACDMDPIMELCAKYNLFLIEDCAQAIDSTYKGKPLGSFGDFSAYSFHETKNVISGEGGLLVVNNEKYLDRSEIIWEKGTNRAAFFRGEVDKYGWVDKGSSFLASELNAAYLYGQLECLELIQNKRIKIVERYRSELSALNQTIFELPVLKDYTVENGHMFYLLFHDLDSRSEFIRYMRAQKIHCVFHYLSLHRSDFFKGYDDVNYDLPYCDQYADTLVRLPVFYELSDEEQEYIIGHIKAFVEK